MNFNPTTAHSQYIGSLNRSKVRQKMINKVQTFHMCLSLQMFGFSFIFWTRSNICFNLHLKKKKYHTSKSFAAKELLKKTLNFNGFLIQRAVSPPFFLDKICIKKLSYECPKPVNIFKVGQKAKGNGNY